jgi:steroid delta-isomerase-like uncharacterized protein
VDNRDEIRDFLTSRRARITPQQAGLPAYSGRRRVAGLRREEVALLAGVSVDYYTRLERGDLKGVSDGVLDAVADALRLDEPERAHLINLAQTAKSANRVRRRPASTARRRRKLDSAFAAVLASASVAIDEELRRRREEICLGHMRAENAHRFDEAIGFFARPRYELLATGEVYDGAGPLGGLMQENVTAFPDFHYDHTHIHHADDAIVVEGSFRGTHEGIWRGLPATGRRVDFPMLIVFPFEGEAMMGERIYFDLSTALRQLGVARDPNTMVGRVTTILNHPITIGRALLRGLAARRR